jgi:serine/threonine-protein kinase
MVDAMDTAAIGKDLVGTVIDGRFTLIQWLGGSAAGEVFLTEADGQRAVIKLIPADAVDAEARTAAWAATSSLSHPHLVRLLQTGHCQANSAPLFYAVTEYSEELLSQIIPERPLTSAEAREMLDPILDAISYLHSKGIVHGHLKPSNIMVVDDQLKISCDDLHLAGEATGRAGAPDIYTAPECAGASISPAADLWSLGVTLVESLTQHPPVWLPPDEIDPRVPKSIEQPFAGIARECLHSDPARRCNLEFVKTRLHPDASLPDRTSSTVEAAPAKFPVKTLIAAGLVLVAVVAGLLLWSHRAEPGPETAKEPVLTNPASSPQSPVPVNQTVRGASVKGAVAERVLPDVLPSAQESIEGKVNVSVRVAVDATGMVSNAALDSPGPSKYFAKQAMQAAQRWRFKPAQADGKAVASTWILRFHFTQSGTDITPVEVSP